MRDDVASGSSDAQARLRVAGAWAGKLEVPLDTWTVANLRVEIARLAGFGADSINMICAGRILKDDAAGGGVRSLREVGIADDSKILLTRSGVQQAAAVNSEKQRSDRLARIKAAVDAMAKRSSEEDDYPVDNFDIQLENQSGEKLQFSSDDDRKALIMGLMLHSKARSLLQQNLYDEALEVLAMAEEAFSLCDRKILEAVDNVALLQIDTVWSLFMLRDIARLAVARERLKKAREGLLRSHGKNLERLRVLQGGFCPELALYVRLELLEGVVAYHSGLLDAAQHSLLSAQRKFHQLQVSDEAVASLVGMGFSLTESRRALRVSGQDMQRAVDFVVDDRHRKSQKLEDDRRRQQERREQKRYGKTLGGKAVDIGKLSELASLGYNRRVAAEALKQSENDRDMALEMLLNPASLATLQVCLDCQPQQLKGPVDETALAELMSMGFDQEKAMKALQRSESTAQAIERLLQAPVGSNDDSQRPAPVTDSSGSGQDLPSRPDSPVSMELDSRDEEMEQDIAQNVTGDPLAEYDIEVHKEGEAISEYLGLLKSIRSSTSKSTINSL
ncbi:unnamed protein product [Sphagnum tenellum]